MATNAGLRTVLPLGHLSLKLSPGKRGKSFNHPELKEISLQIQINTGNQIEGGTELTQEVEAVVENALGRFHERITRVEVFLSDKNSSQKSNDNDIRCVMEARLSGMQPIVVTADGSSLEQALHGAANKLKKTLKRTLGRLDHPKGRMSYAGDQS